jgi:uncharacterized repeat protein (TIGR03833 family)
MRKNNKGLVLMSGNDRKNVRPGLTVEIVLKENQRTGCQTRGVVQEVLTKSLRLAALVKAVFR